MDGSGTSWRKRVSVVMWCFGREAKRHEEETETGDQMDGGVEPSEDGHGARFFTWRVNRSECHQWYKLSQDRRRWSGQSLKFIEQGPGTAHK